MADWKDILSNDDNSPENDELLNYVNNQLSEAEKNSFEQKTLQSAFTNDAVEGLEEIVEKEKLQMYVQQLNKNLQQQLANKKTKKQKRSLRDQPWTIIAVLFLLALCILGFVMIRLYISST